MRWLLKDLAVAGRVGDLVSGLPPGENSMDPTDCEAIVCEDGWYEIRDTVSPHRWIATDQPVECRP